MDPFLNGKFICKSESMLVCVFVLVSFLFLCLSEEETGSHRKKTGKRQKGE